MHLHKRILALFLLTGPFLCLLGYWQIADQQFKAKNWDDFPVVIPGNNALQGLWHEILIDTHNDPHAPLPRITIMFHAPHDRLEDCSKFTGRKKQQCKHDNRVASQAMILGVETSPNDPILLFFDSLRKTMRELAHKYWPMTSTNQKMIGAIPACFLAHEMLHVALDLRGVPALDQHRVMRDQHYLLHALIYLNKSLGLPPNGFDVKETMDGLDYSVKLDEITRRREQREVGK
ncbi:hypothetical protein KGO95_04235 [Patescibacteria group bacterium]|nr:hypothetical protein [Patescibacteria group bacterium]